MASQTSPVPSRVLAVDILRGLTIAVMILVNDPGDPSHVYRQLDHSAWNGCTLTDLVFPSFLFLVGCSAVLSTETRLGRGQSRASIARNVLRRSALLFALDLFFAAFPHFHLGQLRLYGVLTRIAVCYLLAGLLTLLVRRISTLLLISASLLVGYWAIMRLVPIPGLGRPAVDFPLLDPDRNLAAWIDRGVTAFLQRTIHTGVLYERTRDPEGLLSTIPALATTLLGAATALWLRKSPENLPAQPRATPGLPAPRTPWYPRTEEHRRDGLFAFGLLLLLLGLVWSHWFPLNKKLWTSSYVLFAGGCSTLALAVLYWIYDVRHLERRSPLLRAILKPCLIFGSNAITAYAVSVLLVETMLLIRLPAGHLPALASSATASLSPTRITAWLWTYRHLFAPTGSNEVTSLLFAVAVVAVCFVPNYILWRKRIFLKI